MNMRALAVTAIVVGMAITTAHAGWQNTKWGMSKDQVKRTMIGSSVQWDTNCAVSPPEPKRWSMHMSYVAGQFSFVGCADGSDSGLDKINLSLNANEGEVLSTTADKLKQELLAKYGTPFSERQIGYLTEIEWHQGEDKIEFTTGIPFPASSNWLASLAYSPLATPSNKGL